MTPKEQYRIQRRSLRYDATKKDMGLRTYSFRKFPAAKTRSQADAFWRRLCLKWERENLDLIQEKPDFFWQDPRFEWGATTQKESPVEVERYLRDTWAPVPGFKYLPTEHPVRLTAQEKAQAYEPHFMDDFRWRSGDATLPPPVEYAPVKQLRRVRQAPEKTDPYYVPPQLWLPEDVLEAETASSHSDPLVILLEREGSYHEAYELRQSHRAGTTQTVLKFYMEQRPDRYPQTLPGTVWVSQSSGASEVKPQVRIRRKVA